MMMLLAAVVAQALPATETDVVVIGRRLAQVEVSIGRDARGRATCGLSGSSGSARLDERLCKASVKCVRKVGTDALPVQRCVEAQKPKLLEAFRREWTESRAR